MNLQCPICGERVEDGGMVGYDFDQPKASYALHYTRKAKDPRDTIVLCQWTPKKFDRKHKYWVGKWTQDFYTPHEALQIGCWLLRAVIDLQAVIRGNLSHKVEITR